MGYTHYFYVPDTIADFDGFLQDVNAIVAAASGMRAGVVVDERSAGRRVTVSGGVESLVVSETFEGRRRPGEQLHFDFIKTLHADYDALVVAVLIALKHRDPRVRVSTDGGPADLEAGIALYTRATGVSAKYESVVSRADGPPRS